MSEGRSGGRARAMSREDRRAAIAIATVPLLEQHGAQVSTRQIALAAGVAEGTLFRAFDDKVEILTTAAEHALDPTSSVAQIDDLPRAADLAAELAQVVDLLADRGRRVRQVMLAVHGILASEEGRRAAAVRAARGADVFGRPVPGPGSHEPASHHADATPGTSHPHPPHPGPHGHGRQAHLRAMTETRSAIARRLEPYRQDLRVDPERVAHLLLAAVMGQGPPGLLDEAEIPAADLVDVLLHGAARPTGTPDP